MTATLDMPAHRLFRAAIDLVRSYPLGDDAPPPALAGWPAVNPAVPPPVRGPVSGPDGDLWDTASRLRAGDASVEEVVAQARQRIARYSARYRAHEYVAETGEPVATLAREAAAGNWRGPLHGIPISVKDVIDVAGMPTGGGSDAYPTRVAADEGVAVRRLRAAGAVFTGKVSTHEFALGVTTPQSRNPWDDTRIPGGSSGGSVISIVTGMALASLGTDTRASIRVPAALSGAVGFKPSFGRVPVDGLITLSWSMDHIAPIARSVRDIALLMDVLTGSADAHAAALPRTLAGRRLRYASAFLDGAEPPVALLFGDALKLAEVAGARVEAVTAPTREDLGLANAAGMIVSRCEAIAYHQEIGTDLARCTPETEAQLSEAAGVRSTDYLRAQRLRALLRHRFVEALGDADAFIMPATKVLAPRVEQAADYLLVLSENCIPWSFVDFPALSLPMGMAGRLPAGLQLAGRPGDDLGTLALAHALESILPRLPDWTPDPSHAGMRR